MKNKIELKDLGRQYKKYKRQIDRAIQGVIQSTSFISGKEVEVLEKQLADYVGVEHCITCANGTDAMSLVLMAWNIGPGDAVFVPNFTFFATAEVVSLRGATPIFVDVDERTFNINPNNLELAILEVIKIGKLKPKVIIPVDLFGLPADYLLIESIAKKYNLLVLEDAAQGFGGSINNQKTCSFGDAATTSFFPAKPLGCYGDGGAIFTKEKKLADTVKSLRAHGKGEEKYDNVRIGTNSRLDTLQASILSVKLEALINHELDDVNKFAALFNKELSDFVIIPYIPQSYFSSYAQYTIQLESKNQRDSLNSFLKSRSIPTAIFYPKTLHQQKAFMDLNSSLKSYEVSTHLTEVSLSIPIHPYLKKNEINYIIKCIQSFKSN